MPIIREINRFSKLKSDLTYDKFFSGFKVYKKTFREVAKEAITDFDSYIKAEPLIGYRGVVPFAMLRNFVKNNCLYKISKKTIEERLFHSLVKFERLMDAKTKMDEIVTGQKAVNLSTVKKWNELKIKISNLNEKILDLQEKLNKKSAKS